MYQVLLTALIKAASENKEKKRLNLPNAPRQETAERNPYHKIRKKKTTLGFTERGYEHGMADTEDK
ncbi:hypothetical protein AVEN_112716-1, partial [Araneus ventricosus]